MKYNFCPTCGEYLHLSIDNDETMTQCPLGHSLQAPRTMIHAAAILADRNNILLERKFVSNRETWALPHTEINPNEQPENTLSRMIQANLLRIVAVEQLIYAHGDEHAFHLFYELKLVGGSGKHNDHHAPSPYAWYSWKDIPWERFSYRQHRELLLQWFALRMDESNDNKKRSVISQYRGIKIL